MATLYTIGHSTRTLDELIAALRAHSIATLADIRSFPMSRRLPHFNRELLEKTLPEAGIRYIWMKELGGRRKAIRDDSPNIALRNASFRNYADYMLTAEFQNAAAELIRLGEQSPTAYMQIIEQPAAAQTEIDDRGAASGQTFAGMITDSRCGARHRMNSGKTSAECALSCVRHGAHYVLVDGEKVYALEGHRDQLERLAGERANVVGTLEGDTIKVKAVMTE